MIKHIAEYNDISGYSKQHDKIKMPIKGACLEGAGIFDSDIVMVDLTKKPFPAINGKAIDIALVADKCIGNSGEVAVGVKDFIGFWLGRQFVSTHYARDEDNFKLNAMFPVEHVLGVVYACFDQTGALKWEKDISDRPTELVLAPAIKSTQVHGV